MRFAISAAPALVNVRHRIDEGGVPRSSSRSTRDVNTWVLPVPAEADSAAWTSGSEAAACAPSSGWNGFRRRRIAQIPSLSWPSLAHRDEAENMVRGLHERRRQ